MFWFIISTEYFYFQFQAQIIGSYLSPIVVCKDVYIGTIPICFQEMESYMAGMYNHPYNATKYSKDGCVVRTNPSAPPSSITSSDLNEMALKVTSLMDLGGISNCGLRPPPFCPGFDQKLEVVSETAKPGFNGKPGSWLLVFFLTLNSSQDFTWYFYILFKIWKLKKIIVCAI